MLMYLLRSLSILCLAVCVGLFIFILYYERKEATNFSHKPYKKYELPITIVFCVIIFFAIAGFVLFFASFFFTTDDLIGYVDPTTALCYSFITGLVLTLIVNPLYYKKCRIPFYEQYYPQEYGERKDIRSKGSNDYERINFTIFASGITSFCILIAEIVSFF